jgi:two-component system NarL family response regulator
MNATKLGKGASRAAAKTARILTMPPRGELRKQNTIRVLIADDHLVVREGLASIINRRSDMKVVAEAGSGAEALQQFILHRPDVTLVDLRMPGMDGVDTIQAIRRQSPTARLILLTTYDGDENIYRGLRAGAMAYLTKDTGRDELLSCIRNVHAGMTWIRPAIAAKLAGRLQRADLTKRELEVLRLLVIGKSNKEIGAALNVCEGTVKIHVNHIFKKLGAAGRTEATTLALKRGVVRFWNEIQETCATDRNLEALVPGKGKSSFETVTQKFAS